jgi:hypothetical protein
MSRFARVVGRRYTSVRQPLSFLWRNESGVRAIAALALAIGAGYLVWRVSLTLAGSPTWLSLPLLDVEVLALVQLALFARQAWRVPSRPRASHRGGQQAGVVVLAAGGDSERLHRTLLGVRRMRGVAGCHVTVDGDMATALTHVPGELVVVLAAGQVPREDLIERAEGRLAPGAGAVALSVQLVNPDALDQVVDGHDERALKREVVSPALGARAQAVLPEGGYLARRSALEAVAEAAPGLGTTAALWRAGWGTVDCGEPLIRDAGTATIAAYLADARRHANAAFRAAADVLRPGLAMGQRLTLAGSIAPFTAGLRWRSSSACWSVR